MKLVGKDNCCGCGACKAICPQNAIQMNEDEEGFSYPDISGELCVNCGLCQKVCPVRIENQVAPGKSINRGNTDAPENTDEQGNTDVPGNADTQKNTNAPGNADTQKNTNAPGNSNASGYQISGENSAYKQRYFAAFHKKDNVVENSSSGGVFTAVTDTILSHGGAVYGVYMDETFVVRHGRAKDSGMRDLFRGSKYVQSNMQAIFEEIAEDVSKGNITLFTGTPCQVKAIQNFLREKRIDTKSLYTIDFICHGVSSPKIWNAYIDYLEERYDCKLQTYVFRGKKEGWHNWYPVVKMGNKDVSEELRRKDSYILMYQSMLFHRPSCFYCPFTSYERAGDMTLADFWNIKKIAPEMDTGRGTSELFINSPKGQELLDSVRDTLELLECSKQDVWQPHLEYPNAAPRGREKFWNCFHSSGMKGVIKKYGRGDAMTRLKNYATPILKKTGLYVLFGKLYQKIFIKK